MKRGNGGIYMECLYIYQGHSCHFKRVVIITSILQKKMIQEGITGRDATHLIKE